MSPRRLTKLWSDAHTIVWRIAAFVLLPIAAYLAARAISDHVRQLKDALPVGSYPDGASPDGVLDLAGNASEWVADWFNWDGYWDLPNRNPVGLGPEWNRALRGSSWVPYGVAHWAQERSRCSARDSTHRRSPDARFGFRCARSVP